MGVFDFGDLRERNGYAVARRHGKIADMAEIEPFRRHRTRHHLDLLDAVAHRCHGHTRDQHRKRLRDVLRGQSQCTGAVLIDHELEIRRLFVPVELRILDVLVLPDDIAHLVGDLADDLGIGPDHPELDREANRRPEIEAIDAHPRFGQIAFINRLFDSGLDPLARLDVLGDDHDLGESLVRELRD